jgi:hypothetical protein
MRRFSLLRKKDATGISGTGVIAEGAIFGDGTAVLRWLSTRSIATYPDWDTLLSTHGHGGATVPLWHDPSEDAPRPCTVYPSGEASTMAPMPALLDGWREENGSGLFVGQSVRLSGGSGEVSDTGEVTGLYVSGSHLMVSLIGTDCGPAAYYWEEVIATEDKAACLARNDGVRPRYGWAPAITLTNETAERLARRGT